MVDNSPAEQTASPDVSVAMPAENAAAVQEPTKSSLSQAEDHSGPSTIKTTTEVIPPVPTDEHRTSLQAATIDTFSPSVASTVLSAEHHGDEPQPDGPNVTSAKPSIDTASDHVTQLSHTEGENDPDMVLAQLLSMGFEVEVCEVAIAECVADRDGRDALGQSLLETSIRWIISRQGGDGPRGIQCGYSCSCAMIRHLGQTLVGKLYLVWMRKS